MMTLQNYIHEHQMVEEYQLIAEITSSLLKIDMVSVIKCLLRASIHIV